MERLEHDGMTCGAFSHDAAGAAQRCGAPAVWVDQWVRSDGKSGRRYYCALHAAVRQPRYLTCAWRRCKGEVVAIVHDAPMCAEHAEIERARQ